ncbi:5'/3'-nucleotidase SurE [bacterium]|nr:5'/3'-nucleotidase SurE [bacterium]
MAILLTNDDGIHAEGLLALRRELDKIGETTVFAPSRERSGVAHGVTISRPIAVEEVMLDGANAYAVDGTPVDCVKIAVKGMGTTRPELVVSGINSGSNVGIDVIYSGTVSAAVEAAIMGLPAVAISLARQSSDFSYAARFGAEIAQALLEDRFLPPGVLLNINVPGVPEGEIRGVAITKQSRSCYGERFEREDLSPKKMFFTLTGKLVDLAEPSDVDVTALSNNYISVTPIHFDLTHYPSIEALLRRKIGK